MIYSWQNPNWPAFKYNLKPADALILNFMDGAGQANGLLEGLGETDKLEALIQIMTLEALKTSEIEGEYLSRRDVVSSIRNNLGLASSKENIRDKRAQGAANLMMAVRNDYAALLSQEMLFDWHEKLMSGVRFIRVGRWRDHADPMQVVSGPIGKEKIHFEAPPSDRVPELMRGFIEWFNKEQKAKSLAPPVYAAIAHLHFETIHPFEDGNGRIGRAISEKALSLGLARPVTLSLSRTIEADKKAYYEALKSAQRTLDITEWICYFAGVCVEAQTGAKDVIQWTLNKAKFFDSFRDELNERQTRVLTRMTLEGPGSFKDGMSAKKYIAITGTSKPTATRDLQELSGLGALIPAGGGRSTRYHLPFGKTPVDSKS